MVENPPPTPSEKKRWHMDLNRNSRLVSQDSLSEVVGRLAQVKLSLLCWCASRAMTSLQDRLPSLIPALLDYRVVIVNQETLLCSYRYIS